MNAKEVLAYAKKNNVVMVDLRFIDWPGTWQHCSFPISEIDESVFEDGLGFDGSSIRGWQAINESDMLMVPDAATGFIDPFFAHPTLVMICDIEDPITRESYSRDPRYIAKKAERGMGEDQGRDRRRGEPRRQVRRGDRDGCQHRSHR